jgi:hypothetical protein
VGVFFISADDVGVGRSTVEKYAERDARGRCTGRPSGNIARQRKVRKHTGSMKKSEG